MIIDAADARSVRDDQGDVMVAALEVGPTTTPLLDETIGQNLARTVSAHGSRDAVVSRHQAIRWTYDEFAERVDRLARGLLATGLDVGDRVGLWSPNCAEWVLIQYATAEIGVILVNINPAYRTHELAYALQQSGCRMVIAAPEFKSSDYRAMVAEVAPECPELERSILLWDPEWFEVADGDLDVGAELDARRALLDMDDPINIQYTSGTTGFPKGATLSHRNILNNGVLHRRCCMNLTEHDRVCIPVPFYHCFGMVMGNLGCTTHGATMVIPARGVRSRAALETVEAERCTALYGVPTMFIAELDATNASSEFDLSTSAHRHHGRLALPGGGDESVHRQDAHGRGDHLLRHDRDVAGVDADAPTTRSTTGSPRSARCTRTSRSEDRRPDTGETRRARRARRVLHARATR